MRNKKNAILISIIVVFALIFVGAVGYLIYGMIRNQSSEDEYKNMASSFAGGITDGGATNSSDNPEGYTGNLENKTGTTSPEQVDQTVSVKVKNVDTPVSFEELKAQDRQGNGAVRSQYGKRSNVCQSSYVCRFKLL